VKKESLSLYWIDLARFLASLSVVVLHVSAVFMSSYGLKANNDYYFIAGNIFDSMVRWCVPVFIMISGYLTLNSTKIISFGPFLMKKAERILLPLFFWSVVYFAYYVFTEKYLGADPVLLSTFFKSFLLANHTLHLYFLFVLFGLFCFSPILIAFVRQADEKEVLHATIFLFAISSIPPIIYYGFPSELNPGRNILISKNSISYFINFSGYFLGGYYLVKVLKVQKVYVYLLGFLLSVVATILFTHLTKNYQYFYNYNSLNVILMSGSVFLLIKELGMRVEKSGKIRKSVTFLSQRSFGVYLLHPIVMWLFPNFREIALGVSPFISILFLSVCIYLISVLLVTIASKIRFLNRIV